MKGPGQLPKNFTGDASLQEIAERVGYSGGMTLGTLLRRQLGVGVEALRRVTGP